MRKNILKKMVKATAMALATATVITAAFVVQPTEAVQAAKAPKLNKTNITMYVGDMYQLKVKNTNKKITWTTSKKKVAAVTSKGLVKAKKVGMATIKAKVSSKKVLKCTVNVKKAKKDWFLNTKLTLHVGESSLLIRGNYNGYNRVWSYNDHIATINAAGRVVATGVGKTTILVMGADKQVKVCEVTVVKGKATKCSHNFVNTPAYNAGGVLAVYVDCSYEACRVCNEKFMSSNELTKHQDETGHRSSYGELSCTNYNVAKFGIAKQYCTECGLTK